MGITGVHIQGFFKVVLTSDARNFFSCTTPVLSARDDEMIKKSELLLSCETISTRLLWIESKKWSIIPYIVVDQPYIGFVDT